ncbi:MAG TPA: hypothetical protein VGM87_21725 [Roseomonas sp.]|jgi:hypothetical protein
MSPWLILALLPFGALYAFATGRLAICALHPARIEAVPAVMALSAVAHLIASRLLELGPMLALTAFWSFTHLVALPFVARGIRPGA